MKKRKWYLQTWFICILFMFWPSIISIIVGIVLLTLQMIENNKLEKKYGDIDSLNNKITDLEKEIDNKKTDYNNLCDEINVLEGGVLCQHYCFADYDGISSEECKNNLAVLKLEEQNYIKNSNFIKTYGNSPKKMLNANTKQILRCFNAECDNVLLNLSIKTIDSARNKITKSFETLNKLFDVDNVQLNQKLLQYKLDELNLVYTYELKKEQEREQQKAIKEQMIEEEK